MLIMDRADLAIKMAKLVHDKCKDVPHDIGLQLLYLIEEYDGVFCPPPVICDHHLVAFSDGWQICTKCDECIADVSGSWRLINDKIK